MSEKNITSIIVGIIGAVATIIAAIIGAVAGNGYAQSQQNQYIQSHTIKVNGDGNTITINNVDDLIKGYNNLLSENETLKAKNTSYFNDLTDAKNQLEAIQSQMNDTPQIMYKNYGLILNAQEIPINKNKSMITVDGREYFSKEVTEKLLPDNKIMTIKNDTIFVGKVTANSANLMDKWIIEKECYETKTSVTDSLGNTYTNCILLDCGHYGGNVIYNINNEYSMLRAIIAVSSNTSKNLNGVLSIEADGQIVYLHENLNIHTQPIEIDIPINNCTELKINCSSGYFKCIISDAILYNE